MKSLQQFFTNKMNKKHYLTVISTFAIFFITSCTPNRYITYSVNKITTPETIQTISINVEVKTLTDNRANVEGNKVLFSNPRNIRTAGARYCINSEKHYHKEAVASQITQLMVKHFNQAKLFTTASYNESIDSDYYLTGILNNFYGEQDFATQKHGLEIAMGVTFGILGGLVGGAIAAGIVAAIKTRTHGKTIIEISDLKLFRKDGTLIWDFGNFYKEYEGSFPANTDCWCIYQNVNKKLKDFNTQLIETIRTELLDVNL